MTKKTPTVVYFVTWPDGKLFEGSQTSISGDHALAKAVRTWLIHDYFPGVEFGGRWGGGVLWHLWPAMEKAGFKVHELEVPTDVADGVSH